ncbi:hypothetical protein EMIHUDRAFT_468332 [Emiliania huxleyi CCMP1516]|uniref:Sodium/hydrogen exchanger n=3 Tax=Emiliania huxleyi TaxID=2903 RepID=A0A0D3K4C6_EMIH1|nr:hypothetical protein EMIHUDRAFT_468332 [Emiliania huxleyi CCMP1516]EOD30611.1 hypothetical protein EMIHUDRAFT_468332 [Emiliania huxleyi CCMP1516]|eukprot:XP_005783040.1 hypothetical protein EMIHUDRAFT_468332 [Emiliania huxleyi CCMP1516]
MLCVVLLPPEEWPGRASAPTSVELRFVRSASELDAADAAAAEGIVAVPGCDIGALRGLLAALPRCAWLHSFSAGVDGIAPVLRETPDTLRASNARGAFTSSLAEYALAAALHFNKQVPRCMANRAAGRWERFTMNVLRGKTLGLLGYGSIARATAKLAAAFGMRIIALRRNVGGEAGEVVPEATYGYDDRAAFFGAPPAREVAPQSAAAFEAMKESAVFISLGRGDVVDEAALVAALSRGRICGAALDVFEQANPLTHHAHWALHAHNADLTSDYFEAGWATFVANAEAAAAGRPLLTPHPPLPPTFEPSDSGTALSVSVICALLLAGLLLRHYMEQREWTRVTETGACMFLGAAFNVAFWTFSRLKSGGSENWRFSISMSENMHDVIYFGLLPPIIFEAGFVMRKRSFFANFGTILLYAVVGTLISILCTGGLTYALSLHGFVTQDFSFSEALLFGALISSTDPVATLSILKSAPPLLYDLVFGEAALNDALSIVLFNIFRHRCGSEWAGKSHQKGPHEGPDRWPLRHSRWPYQRWPYEAWPPGKEWPPGRTYREPHHGHTLLDGVLSAEELPPAPAPAAPPPPPWYLPLEGTMTLASEQLVQILPLSLLIGVSAGLLTALATKRLGMQHQSRAYAELSLLLVTALLTYTLTDEVALSGILSLFFAGVTMRHYTYYNLSPAAQATSRTLFATLASLCDIALSIILGIAVIDYLVHGWTDVRVDGVQGHEVWDFSFVLSSVVVLLLARALNIFPLTELANCCRRRADQISCRMQLVMWWSGLRGAVSFALAMTLDDPRPERQVMPPAHAKAIVTTTLAVIVFTNLCIAPLTAPLLRRVKLERRFPSGGGDPLGASLLPQAGDGGEPGAAGGSRPRAATASCDGRDVHTPPLGRHIHRAWRALDQHYMKPIFGGRPDRRHEVAEEALAAGLTTPLCLSPEMTRVSSRMSSSPPLPPPPQSPPPAPPRPGK